NSAVYDSRADAFRAAFGVALAESKVATAWSSSRCLPYCFNNSTLLSGRPFNSSSVSGLK
ncbi:hypothetical protein ACTXQV_66145, partial [Klebsiella pneumoniae]